MTLVRRCDGCGNDIVHDPKGPIDNYISMRVPNKTAGRTELEFHDANCIGLWVARGQR